MACPEQLSKAQFAIRPRQAVGHGKSKGVAEIDTKPTSAPPLSAELRKGLEALTKRQVDCLRLAGKRWQTKEIAEELTMSPGRVDKQIFAARQRLGGLTRLEAGRLLIAWEGHVDPAVEGGHSMGAQSISLPSAMDFASSGVVHHDADALEPADETLIERQVTYAPSPALADRYDLVPLRHSGRRSNDLSSNTILSTIARLMLGALFAVGSALSLLSSLTTLTQH